MHGVFQLGATVVDVELRRILGRRRMQNEIAKLKRHFVICGLGRMGIAIAEHLAARKTPFVVIDVNEEVLEAACRDRGWLGLVGDATDDTVLTNAGIERARGLATVLPTDADNVYVVLSARMLCSDIQIIARASDDAAMKKLERAGATRVVSPFSSGAVKMARFLLNPSIEDFLEVADDRGSDLELADVQITEDNPLVGKQLAETDLRERGVMVIGIRRANGERLLPPPGTAVIQAGDSLFAFGSSDVVNAMIGEQAPL
jgi:voltage-gated potassium channel